MPKPRKPHNPRRWQPSANATMQPLRMSAGANTSEQIQLIQPVREAFDRLRTAQGAAADFNMLNEAIQCAGACCAYFENAQDADLQVELVNRGANALQRMRDRYLAGHPLRFDGQGLQHTREALDIYYEFLETLTRKQVCKAMDHAMARIRLAERTASHAESPAERQAA